MTDVKNYMLDSAVYQGPSIIWVSAWRSRAAVENLEKAIRRTPGDDLKIVAVERDYTKIDRKDAPSEMPGGISKL